MWKGHAAAIARQAQALGESGLAGPVDYLGPVRPGADVLVDRALETWIHAEDLRSSHGAPTEAPRAADITQMSGLGARVLASARAVVDARYAETESILELDGARGGCWLPMPTGVRALFLTITRVFGDDSCAVACLTVDVTARAWRG